MAKIDKLTPEQEKQMIAFREEWLEIGLSTEPADRPRAEAGITRVYELSGYEKPEFVWMPSPKYLKDNKSNIARKYKIDKKDIDPTATSQWGQHDAYWIAYYLFPLEIGLVTYDEKDEQLLRAMAEIAQSAMWWYPYEKVCFVSERPSSIVKDEVGRMHNESGPAFSFNDGFVGYYWHGVRVDERIIERPETITAKQIMKESNAEVRRAMMSIHGFDKCLEELDAKQIQSDGYGDLYEIILDNEPQRFVKVVNGTQEPDGTYKDYVIPVERDHETAHEAVAWTFGRTVETYAPEIRT